MTTRLFLKALLLLWPYLRSAIFKDRTVAEVVKENAHLTVMLGLIICLTVALILTTLKLAEVKELQQVKNLEPASPQCVCNAPLNPTRLRELLLEH